MQPRIFLILTNFLRLLNGNTQDVKDVNQQQLKNDTWNNEGDTKNVQRSTFEFGNEDKYLNTSGLLKKYRYPVEVHFVITEDGYNLTLFRVPNSGPAVFLMHGLISSSDDFLVAGPSNALAYILHDAGYDVWIGNARGNKYSRRHVRMSPQEREFWEFTWHEIGYYDLPAMIDVALTISNRSQLVYVGHSQGTTVFYVLCSERLEYNQKISFAFSLATVAYTWHMPLSRALEPFQNITYDVAFNTGFYEVLPFYTFQFVTSVLCDLSGLTRLVCITVLFSAFGFDYEQIDHKQLSVQLAHYPAGSSLKQVIHYLQNAHSKRFAKYNHGERRNLELYGSPVPPSYSVKNITVPISIYYGVNDFLSNFEDLKILLDELPHVVDVHRVPFWKFNHFDYLWAKDARDLVSLRIVARINKLFGN